MPLGTKTQALTTVVMATAAMAAHPWGHSHSIFSIIRFEAEAQDVIHTTTMPKGLLQVGMVQATEQAALRRTAFAKSSPLPRHTDNPCHNSSDTLDPFLLCHRGFKTMIAEAKGHTCIGVGHFKRKVPIFIG